VKFAAWWCLVVILVCAGTAPLASAASVATVENIRIGLTPGNTRVVLDLDQSVSFSYQQLENPSRLVLDLGPATMDIDLEELSWRGAAVRTVRRSKLAGSNFSLIFELRGEVEPLVFFMEKTDVAGHRLVVDLKERKPSSSTEVKAVRVGQHEDFTRFVFDADIRPGYKLAISPDKQQLILELDNIAVDTALLELPLTGTPVSAIMLQGKTRLLFNIAGPVEPRAFVLAPDDSRDYRLVLDLYPVQELVGMPAPPSTALAAVAVNDVGSKVPGETKVPRKPKTSRSGNRRAGKSGSASKVAFSGTWQQEWAIANKGGNQKFEAIVEPRFDVRLPEGAKLTAIGRLRLDAMGDLGPGAYRPFNYSAVNGPWYNDDKGGIELREFYIDWKLGNTFLRLGKQQVVWGEADGVKVLDVVNPQSFREFILDDFDDSRIPLWMINTELPLGKEGSLQLLWIPDTTYHELAEPGTPYELTSPLLVPQKPVEIDYIALEPDKPDDPIGDSDLGARYRSFYAGWDISLNYFYSYADLPVPFQQLQFAEDGPVAVLDPAYKRNHLVGGTASSAFGEFSLRTEVAWSSDRWFTSSDVASGGVEKSGELGSVVGVDWQRSTSSLVSAQWFYSRATDYRSTMERGRTEQMVSLLLQQGFVNETWEVRAIALHSLDYNDYLYQLKLKYWFASELELYFGADIFDGKSSGFFGQFNNVDRIVTGFQYGF
jgi:uncharacterized protein DUF1302/AMIN domain-containing protein